MSNKECEQPFKIIGNPNLPISKVKHCIVSPAYPAVIADLKLHGIIPIAVPYCTDIQPQVGYHADMVCCHLQGNWLFCDNCIIEMSELKHLGFNLVSDSSRLYPDYPHDVLYNAAVLGNKLICNENTVHTGLLNKARELGMKILHCNQGYTKCSAAIVDENSIITSDPSIAESARAWGIDLLVISQGGIILEGYSHGFIGGCCGKISLNEIYFTGKLESHPDSKRIEDFIKSRGVAIIEGSSDRLIDIGSIVLLTEESQ